MASPSSDDLPSFDVKFGLEGLTFELRLNLDLLRDGGVGIDVLRAIGGGARSQLWLQLKADITGIPVITPRITEAAAFGAALLAGAGAGLWASAAEAAERFLELTDTYQPDPLRHRAYSDRYELYRDEQNKLDRAIKALSQTDRYRTACDELRKLPGVGLLTAMTFLTEMGDLERFHNRREVAAYLGLCPSSFESGETNDRKGRITRQGPARLRKMLCQAAWVSLRHCEESSAAFHRVKGGKSTRTKKALVAIMRRLAIKMWHRAMACGTPEELRGRGGPHEPIVPLAKSAA